ncbi:MAG: hypothetical protein IH987_21485, partial [Planctomycetes bacterium]|nr:hypothetical protein [Planctomycetota bacterium]
LGIQNLISWAGDVWAGFGILLLLAFPIIMLLATGGVIGILWLVKKYALYREEKSKIECAGCGQPVYRRAVACPNCSEKLEKPAKVGLFGQSKKQQQHEYLYWEFYERGSAQAIRTGKWKGVRKPMLTGDLELYDLDRDIGETNNIAKQNPEVVARILKQMQQAHVPSPDWKIPSKKRPKPGKS